MSVKEKKLLTVPLRVLDAGTGKKNAGKVEMTTLRTLLDTGADENFIDVAVANRMGIRSQTDCNQDESDKVLVEMANGNRIQSLGAMTLKFAIGSRFRGSAKFYIIPLQHTEAILSSHWLHVQDALISMGDWTVQVRYKKSMIQLPVTLQQAGQNSMANQTLLISTEELMRDIKTDEIAQLYQIHMIPGVSKTQDEAKLESMTKKLLHDYQDIIVDEIPVDARPQRELKARIKLKPGAQPVQSKPYPIPIALESELKETLKYMLDRDIIESSSSTFSSPVIFVKKKDGTTRFCVDLRKVNQIVGNQDYPLPVVQQLLERLGRRMQEMKALLQQRGVPPEQMRVLISSMDLSRSYWQVELEESSRAITAFICPMGKFQFKRLPFGLVDSGSQFQKILETILTGLEDVFSYIDDITTVTVGSIEDHDRSVRKVLDRFRQQQLFVKKSKCQFFVTELDFLGFRIGEAGISTQAPKVEAIVARPVPTNVKEVKAWLGIGNYYRRFIPHFAELAIPLTNLLKKNAKFVWTAQCQQALEKLKEAFVKAPILQFFDPSLPPHLFVDASDQAIGASLVQQSANGHFFPVAFYSKRLNAAQMNYSVRERECLAIVSALLHFQYFLYGRKITVHTDHQSLQYLLSQKQLTGRLFRWTQLLADYDLQEVRYIRGEENVLADFLSRPGTTTAHGSSEADERTADDAPEQYNLDPAAFCFNILSMDAGELEVEQSHSILDLSQNKLADDIIKGYPTCPYFSRIIQSCQDNTLSVLQQKVFTFDNTFLYFIDSIGRRRVCIPTAARAKFLELLHDHSAHVGTAKTLAHATNIGFWPKMFLDITKFVNSCTLCMQAKAFRQRSAAIAHAQLDHQARFDKIMVDMMSGLPLSRRKNEAVLVFIDCFSNRIFLYPCKKTLDSKEAARAFYETVYRTQGLPKIIQSDNGSIFNSTFWDEIYELMGVSPKRSSVYYPQSQGRVERANSVLTEALRIFCMKHDEKDWDDFLVHFETIWNSTVRNSTNLTPFQILYGRNVRTVIDLSPQDVSEDVDEVRTSILQNLDIARDALFVSAEKREIFMQKQRKILSFSVGDFVMLSTKDIQLPEYVRKLRMKFIGPLKIISKPSDSTVRLHFPPRFKHLKDVLYNVSKLRPYYFRDPTFELSSEPPAPILTQDGEFYEVKKLLRRRGKGNRTEYLVRWEGYDDPKDDSWVRSCDLSTPALRRMVRDFNEQLRSV